MTSGERNFLHKRDIFTSNTYIYWQENKKDVNED